MSEDRALWSWDGKTKCLVFQDPTWEDGRIARFPVGALQAMGFRNLDQLHTLNPRIVLAATVPAVLK